MEVNMKFFLGLTLIIAAFLCHAEQEANLIENGDFENGLISWKVTKNQINPSKITIDDSVVFIEGQKSLRMDVKCNPVEERYGKKRSQLSLLSNKKYKYVPGRKFILSGWIKGTANINVKIIVDGGIYNKHWFNLINTLAKQEWTQFKKEFTLPEVGNKKYSPERKSFQLRIAVPKKNNIDGTVWIDNLKLEKLN
jgi:carbohydrate binding protein with CBM4/9 domain